MIIWKNTKNYIPYKNPIKFFRLTHIQKKYDEHNMNLNKNNISIYEHIMNNIIKDNMMIIVKNNFPYYIPGFKHYLIWFNPVYKINYKEVYEYIDLKMKNKNYLYFENEDNNKSVLKIRHFHIFVKN